MKTVGCAVIYSLSGGGISCVMGGNLSKLDKNRFKRQVDHMR